jgi:molybdopterin biosynthesis enzyme
MLLNVEVDQAIDMLWTRAAPPETEMVRLSDVQGRVLAADVRGLYRPRPLTAVLSTVTLSAGKTP